MQRASAKWVALIACLTTIPSASYGSQGQPSQYSLLEVPTTNPTTLATKVQVQLSPGISYDLPKVQFSFKLSLVNRSTETVSIHNPIEALALTFTAPDGKLIEMPPGVPGFLINPPQKLNLSPIIFTKANENGKEVSIEADGYQLMPGTFVDISFVCEPVVGERILAALERSKEKFVDLAVMMPLINTREWTDSPIMHLESIRLSIPKP